MLRKSVKRRSGNAFVEYMRLIDWQPRIVIMGGVGAASEEIVVMREEWKDSFELYGFEPSKRVFDKIKDTFPGILKPYGLWNSCCEKTLYTKKGWMDGSSLFMSNADQNEREGETVRCITLDSYFDQFVNRHQDQTPPFDKIALWLDCEGSELQVLQGGTKLLDKVDVLNVEMTCVPRGNNWSKPRDVHKLLESYGFRQAYIHTIRPCIGQYDCIYLSNNVYKPEMTHIF